MLLSENQIELIAEQRMDWLDAEFTSGRLSPADYENALRDLRTWVETQYRKKLH